VLEGLLGVLALGQLIDLQPWQKAEIFLLVAGVVVLVLSLAGQQREQEGHSDLVSFGLLLGSALLALPLAAATAHWRGYWLEFHWPDELGLLVVGLALLLGGNALRLKSPTLVGIMLLAWNLLTLPLFGRKLLEKLPTVGLVLAIGGAVIFGGGLLLALSRDYLLALPDRVKQRRGLFRVLSWR
jgi:hypothetical protein